MEKWVLVDQKDVLRGLTLKVYKFVVKSGKPVGIREIQRALRLSSPTLALYHVNKLEEAGLIKKYLNGFVADKIVLENLVRLRRALVPRHFFYSVFFVTALVIMIVFLRPFALTREYVFGLGVAIVAAGTSIYETVKAYSEKSL